MAPDWIRGFAAAFEKGAESVLWTNRFLSDMNGMYADQAETDRILSEEDPLIYRYHEIGAPEEPGVLSFGITELMPGRVGREYYMTKGHFHRRLMTSEVYLCLEGSGALMLENQEGDWKLIPMRPMEAVYVPKGYAHRSINTGESVLRMFFVYEADAGHDYGTIETRGYRHLVISGSEGAVTADNPKWCGMAGQADRSE